MSSILHSKSVEIKSEVAFMPSVVVGIDIGTASSGYSYAFVKTPNDIICEQLSGGNAGHLKQLTAILLRPDYSFIAFGDAARKEYLESDNTHHELLYFEKFKMVLYGDDLKERPTITAANGTKVASLDVFSAALAYFKDVSLKRLETASNGLISAMDVQFVVTVPAIWSPGAKQLMREAGKKAGLFDKIESQMVLALESEAASLACRERELLVNASQWTPGMRYMVYDLGGGTADMTVHKVTENNTLGEVVESSGGACGSVYVETEFVKLLGHLFGDAVIKSYQTANPIDYIVKHSVTPKDPKIKRLRLPISFLLHLQQKTGQSIEAHITKYADSVSRSDKDSKSDAGDTKTKPVEEENFLTKSDSPQSTSTSFTSSILSHLVPNTGAMPKPVATAAPPVTVAQAATIASAAPSSEKLLKDSTRSDAKKKPQDDEWVFVGESSGLSGSSAVVSYSRGQLKLSHEKVMELFEPVVSKIVAHLNDQLSRIGSISHVFMVGGFSESEVVKAAVEAALVPHKIKTVIPPHAALAVLTGAVLYGLHPRVVRSRIVKRTYGVAVSCEWNPKKHSDRKKSWRPNNGKLVPYCDGIFSPFCLAGDDVKLDYTVSQTYTPGEDNQECMVLKIYQSSSRNVSYIDTPDASLAAQMTLGMADMTGNMERKVQVTMSFGATEIVVTALDLTSGADCSVKLSFLGQSRLRR